MTVAAAVEGFALCSAQSRPAGPAVITLSPPSLLCHHCHHHTTAIIVPLLSSPCYHHHCCATPSSPYHCRHYHATTVITVPLPSPLCHRHLCQLGTVHWLRRPGETFPSTCGWAGRSFASKNIYIYIYVYICINPKYPCLRGAEDPPWPTQPSQVMVLVSPRLLACERTEGEWKGVCRGARGSVTVKGAGSTMALCKHQERRRWQTQELRRELPPGLCQVETLQLCSVPAPPRRSCDPGLTCSSRSRHCHSTELPVAPSWVWQMLAKPNVLPVALPSPGARGPQVLRRCSW